MKALSSSLGEHRERIATGAGRPIQARRADLDGLRAVAIALVAVSHVWTHRVSGGVDVFLLLSGFFVGGGVARACLRGDFDAGEFLIRTGRRLLPPLVVVIASVVVIAAIVAPSTTWAEVSRQAVSSLLYIQNWYLVAVGQEYGAAGVVDAPFQHLWSMSVQGQLFVILAMAGAVALTLRARGVAVTSRRLVVTVSVATASSFACAAVMTVVDQPTAYYDTLSRAWEFLAGALLATATAGRTTPRPARRRASEHARSALGWLALALILSTSVFLDGAQFFPGPAALLPIGAAAVLIWNAGGSWAPSRVLSWRPLAAAGTYAYGFYLWHWPILIFVTEARGGAEVGWLAGSAVLLLSAVLAFATHRVVAGWMNPRRIHRMRNARSWRPGLVLTSIVTVVAVGIPTAWLTHVDLGRAQLGVAAQDLARYPGAAAVTYPDLFPWNPSDGFIPDVSMALEDKSRAVFDGCNSVVSEVPVCFYGDLGADRTVVVAGGSHTEQWTDAIAELGRIHGFRVATTIKWGCELVDGSEGVEHFDEDCVEWGDNALDEILELSPDAVFTTWTRPATGPAPKEMVPVAYERAWTRLTDRSIPVVVIRDNPWVGSGPLECLADVLREDETCGVARADVLDASAPSSEHVESSVLIHPLDVSDVICPEDWCPAVQGGRVVYRDEHHLTNSWVLSTVPLLEERLLPLLQFS